MSRADEIAQGLRDENGGLIGGLVVEDYVRGLEDFHAGREAPRGITSASYDLGRSRARRQAEERARLLEMIEEDSRKTRARVREIILSTGKLDVLAEYDVKMAELGFGPCA